ncbi:MAG: hypothetical protein ACOCVF_03025 [bacterium]
MKNKDVLVLVSDMNYIQHAKALFSNVKNVANWKGSYALIGKNLTKETVKEFESKSIEVLNIESNNSSFFIKFNVFDTYFKRWDNVYYLDIDIQIYKPFQIYIEKNEFYCDFERWSIREYFSMWLQDTEVYNETKNKLFTELDVNYSEIINNKGFNTGAMFFSTSLINHDTLYDLHLLMNKYKEINKHTGLELGTDQPIINLMFRQYAKQFPNNEISYWTSNKYQSSGSHFCRWSVPWNNNSIAPQINKPYNKFYNENLFKFNETQFS